MRKHRFISLCLLLALATLLFWAASAAHRSLIDDRFSYRAVDAPPPENTSPLLAFTLVALGGFRGIVADLLWIRSIEMQAQGRFFELAQLSDWITKLEPGFVRVWAFHAWNMAYNISNFFPDPDDSWRWVQHGISLLRDEAIKLNPTQPALYWELAWLYQHKIGYVMDRSHWYYKLRLATETQAFLDGRESEYVALSPEAMTSIASRYGPFDWRHPSAHALYWACFGRELAPPPGALASDPDALRALFKCERAILQCVSTLFCQGRLYIDEKSGLFITAPNFELLPFVIRSYEEALARENAVSFHVAYADFLANAAFMLSCYGDMEKARAVFDLLTNKYPSAEGDMSLEAYLKLYRSMDFAEIGRDTAMAMVEGALFQSRVREAEGAIEIAKSLEEQAERDWTSYNNSRASEDHRKRTGLPQFSIIKDIARERASTVIAFE